MRNLIFDKKIYLLKNLIDFYILLFYDIANSTRGFILKIEKNKLLKISFIVIMVILALNVVNYLNMQKKEVKIKDDYTAFLKEVSAQKIESVTMTDVPLGPKVLKVKPVEGEEYSLLAPQDATPSAALIENNVKLTVKEVEGPSFLSQFLLSWGPMLFLIAVWLFVMKRMQGGGKGGLFSVNKSKAQLIDPEKIEFDFSKIVGCDEAKLEIAEFVEFLKTPEKFTKLGGRTPKGILLTGPSGTGKTALAKALAKESGVPFFSTSGSEFVEMFVGVGASRVRDMFENAKKAAPCVIFIDEIDAVGGKRNTGSYGQGGTDEREQTLNQLLVELDGMEGSKGIIVVAATNRPEILDPALLRPGRFDRQVVVQLPDVKGRLELLKIYSKNVPIGTNVNLEKIAKGTPGFSGAEISNLINEAALFAGRRGKEFVEQKELDDAKDKILMGVERPSLSMTEEDKRDTAYHESGHAIVAKFSKNADPVSKVTIIPRGRALGVTVQLPEKDRFSHKKEYLIDRIAILMGGRAAEEIFCNTLTTGASNDIQVATGTARGMIMKWGMSSLGPIAFGQEHGGGFLGGGQMNTSGLSEQTLREVDTEVSRLLNEQYEVAKNILLTHRDKVEAMTAALMEVETLDDWQVENICQGRHFNHVAQVVDVHTQNDQQDGGVVMTKPKVEPLGDAVVL